MKRAACKYGYGPPVPGLRRWGKPWHARNPHLIPSGPFVGLRRRPRPRHDPRLSLSLEAVRNIANAAAFAEQRLGAPLNHAITIRWNACPTFDGTDESWRAHQTRFQDLMSRWLRRHGIPIAFAWTRETSAGWGCGRHTHMMVHLPALRRRALVEHMNGLFQFAPHGLHVGGKFGSQTRESRAGSRFYMLKGIDHRMVRYTFDLATGEPVVENVAQLLDIDNRGAQGEVRILRSGVSRTINRAARRAAGWVERRDLASVARLLGG